ncbi:hypothetical protein E8E14_002893 [Neopestalotiopsis sp. 37M]|nr:hypothetical protein E8E14_002893 [Neopestalotiopsis sp. 37M]
MASALAVEARHVLPAVCEPGTETILNSTTIDGKEFVASACATSASVKARAIVGELTARNRNLCGAPCTTYCNSGTGGPNPNDCSSLASSIQNNGGFTLSPGYTYYWSWGSCQAYIVNKESQDQYYCYDQSNFAGVINYLAWNCQASSSGGPYHGGSCHFYDNTGIGWVEVQTV